MKNTRFVRSLRVFTKENGFDYGNVSIPKAIFDRWQAAGKTHILITTEGEKVILEAL